MKKTKVRDTTQAYLKRRAEQAERVEKKKAIFETEKTQLILDYQLIDGVEQDKINRDIVALLTSKYASEQLISACIDALVLVGIGCGQCRASIIAKEVAERRGVKTVSVLVFLTNACKKKILIRTDNKQNALRGGVAYTYDVDLGALDLLGEEIKARKNRLN